MGEKGYNAFTDAIAFENSTATRLVDGGAACTRATLYYFWIGKREMSTYPLLRPNRVAAECVNIVEF